MAIPTRLSVVQEILYEAYNGMPPNDASISENFVLRKVNNWIAQEAVKSAYGTTNIDGITYADDIFNLQFNNITLIDDAIYGIKKITLPALPVGLPRQRSFNVSSTGINPTLFKPIGRFEYQRIHSLPAMGKVYYFVEADSMYFDLSFATKFNKLLSISTVNLVITTSGALDLSASLNLPDDMIENMKSAIVMELRMMMGVIQQSAKTA